METAKCNTMSKKNENKSLVQEFLELYEIISTGDFKNKNRDK